MLSLHILCNIRSNVSSQKVPEQWRVIIADKYFPVHFLYTKNVWRIYLEYLLMGAPSGPMRNFSKFQAMSVLLTGRQIRNCGLAIRLSGSSLGAGRDFFRNLNTGCSFSPLASTFKILFNVYIFKRIVHCTVISSSLIKIPTLSNNSPLNSNPFPGLTCFRALIISCPPEFSWWPN